MIKNYQVKLLVTGAALLLGATGASALFFAWRSKSSHAFDMQRAVQEENVVPILIIGSGPAALSAGVYGARSNIKTVIIAGNEPGGALTKTSYIENWPAIKKALGTDVMMQMQEQARDFGAEIMSDTVTKVDFSVWPFKVMTDDEKLYHALSVIICTGSTPRTLGIPGEKEYWGKGVTTCAVCDAPFHKDKEVVVIGGGDSAVEEAVQLAGHAKKITILVRGDKMRAAASMQERLRDYPSIEIKFNTQPRTVIGDGTQVTGIEIFDKKNDTQSTMQVSGVFLAIGHDPNVNIFKPFIKISPYGTIHIADRTQRTSVEGVFAAGDVTDHQYRQAGVAAGDGIKAALDAVAFLQENGFSSQLNMQLAKKSEKSTGRPVEAVEIVQIKTLPELNEILKAAEGLVVVDFYTPYCPSCIKMLPALKQVAQEYADSVAFLKVDAAFSTDIAKEFHVATVPCVIFFKKGQIAARVNRALSKKEIEQLVVKFDGEDA